LKVQILPSPRDISNRFQRELKHGLFSARVSRNADANDYRSAREKDKALALAIPTNFCKNKSLS
jgi:hypothetical protein